MFPEFLFCSVDAVRPDTNHISFLEDSGVSLWMTFQFTVTSEAYENSLRLKKSSQEMC